MPTETTETVAPISTKPLLDVNDLAKRLNVSVGWVYDHSNGRRCEPKIPKIKLGGCVRFREEDVDELVKKMRGTT
jgi:predicted DNA-binding transcriptional regulator AlpA